MFPHQLKDGISLEGLCRYLVSQGLHITKQSLQDRFTVPAVNFFKSIVAHATKIRLKASFVNSNYIFGRILVDDSTVFELPEKFHTFYRGSGGGASRAAIKVHYCFDLLSGALISLANKEGVQPDQTLEMPDIKPNDLLIEDLGFFRIERFKTITKLRAWFLSRLKLDTNIYLMRDGNYQVFDLLKEERKMQPGEIRDLNVFIGSNDKFPVRLIVEKVDTKIASEKRRKLRFDKQNKRKNITNRRLRLCNLNVHITNTSVSQIPKEIVRKYYSLRWQIEIMFKAWKSVYNIDLVKSMKIERFECMHYGLLTLIILTHSLYVFFKSVLRNDYNEEISELKFFSTIKETLPILNIAIPNRQKLRTYINQLWEMVAGTCTKNHKTHRQSPYDIMNEIA